MLQNNLFKVYESEYWTSKQRQLHSIHYSVSYRASFKPELPAFFIDKFLENSKEKIIFDPFGGRGTTMLQANLQGHFAIHNDITPLSLFLVQSRRYIPSYEKIEKKLNQLDLNKKTPETKEDESLLHFYHKDTLNEIKNLKNYIKIDKTPEMQYIGLTALSRLHGHSKGFFSVYTFPQISILPERQKLNNEKKGLLPDYRELKSRILKKIKKDLKVKIPKYYNKLASRNYYTLNSADNLVSIPNEIVDLIITSPPFLNKVDYYTDNWLRYWFLDLNIPKKNKPTKFKNLAHWCEFLLNTLKECKRVLKQNSFLVMEVGEVTEYKRLINLNDHISKLAIDAGLEWYTTYINQQKFTKLSNCWGVKNNQKGTNSNRCVVFRKF